MNQCDHKIKIIGLGGIGSILSEKLSRFLNFSKDNAKITLIDGDKYEVKNFVRQDFANIGNKSDVKKFELGNKFDTIEYESFPFYVTQDKVKDLIENGDVVFLAVDNHKTRKVVSDFVKTLNDIVLISGGNDYIDGNVQIYIKEGGEEKTPAITDYHPEIDEPDDKSPEEMGCEELAKSEPQLYFTNLFAATLMCCSFYNVLKGDRKISEVYFDIEQMNSMSKQRELIKK